MQSNKFYVWRDFKERQIFRCKYALQKAIADCGFPRPIRPTPKTAIWPQHEVDAWLAERAEARDK